MTGMSELTGAQLSGAAQAVLARGDELERSGAVQLVRFGPLRVTAEVDDSAACVDFQVADGVLRWSCTCREGREGAFCAHCAATAQSVRRKTERKAFSGVSSVTASESAVRIAS
ncbi:SWIM zinc finger family protein [Planomonospora algeriensis]